MSDEHEHEQADEQRMFIGAQLAEGKRREEVRQALISQGMTTADFVRIYNEVAADLEIDDRYPSVADVAAQAAAHETNIPTSLQGPTDTPPVKHVVEEEVGEVPGVFALCKEGMARFWRHATAAGITIFVTVASAIGVALFPEEPTTFLQGAFYVGALIALLFAVTLISIFVNVALFYVILKDRPEITFAHGLQWVSSRFFSVLWLSILAALISLITLAAFILPGLIFVVCNLFSVMVLMHEDQRGVRAIVRSTDIVLQNFWLVVWRSGGVILILMLIIVPLSLVYFVAALILSPVFAAMPPLAYVFSAMMIVLQTIVSIVGMGALAALFSALISRHPFFDGSAYRGLTWMYRLLAVLGLVLPVALGYVYVTTQSVSLTNMTQSYLEQYVVQEAPRPDVDTSSEFGDLRRKTKVDFSFASARIYVDAVGTYEAACEEVTIEVPTRCQATETTFVLDIPLTDGTFYCRDHTGFADSISTPAPSALGCQ